MLNKQDLSAIKEELYSSFLYIEEPFPAPSLIRTKLTSILAQIRRYMHVHHLNKGDLEIAYEAAYEAILYRTVLYGIVQELIIFIQLVFEEVTNHEKQAFFDAVEQAIYYLEKNYWNSKLSLQDAASAVKRNPSYLSHLIKDKTGISFRKQLQTIRLQEAKRLLMETPLTIKEIADLCGFMEANYFSRCFHQQYGSSPRTYRLKIGQVNIKHAEET